MDMKNLSKLKGLVGQIHEMLSEVDEEVVDDKMQYSREDDQGEDSDGDDADEGMKAKAAAMMLKKKMMEDED